MNLGDNMTYNEVMKQLESLGTEQNRKIYLNHGNDLDMFGVSIANLKVILKSIKNDPLLGMKLLKSGNSDAIYLSQWVVDSNKLTINVLESIIEQTNFYMILDNTIPNIAIRSKPLAWQCIDSWIDHKNPRYRQTAYSLYALILGSYPNEEINEEDVLQKLHHIEKVIHDEENRVKYSMNGFVISAGIYFPSLTEVSYNIGERIGKVKVYMGKTSCKVPFIPEYINKVKSMGRIGTKRN